LFDILPVKFLISGNLSKAVLFYFVPSKTIAKGSAIFFYLPASKTIKQ